MNAPLLSFYGDDFTGSTDAMEALARHGVATVLFTRMPDDAEFNRFRNHPGIGLAGTSRSQSPQWMDTELATAFTWLKSLQARFCHYKVCSTFDSSPQTGSIGRAIDIGRAVFGQTHTPLVVGAPQLKRYTAFGHLFAGYQGAVYRIDRHPVMSRHPVTPMDESDLRLHLGRQTATPVSLVSLDDLRQGRDDAAFAGPGGIVLVDVDDPATQRLAGRALITAAALAGPFVAGSSGVEYAVLGALAEAGEITGAADFEPLPKVDRTIVVSGSCSPTTERQIRHGLAHGFSGIAVEALDLAGENAERAIAAVIDKGLAALAQGLSPIIHTALGADTDRSADLARLPAGRLRIGQALGRIARGLIEQAKLSRVIFSGGDTSSHALSELDVFALTTRFPLASAPGSPVCLAHSNHPLLNGLEIAMKGGQIGGDDYFCRLRDGSIQ